MRPKTERLGSQDFAEHQAQVSYELEVVSNKIDRFGWDRMKSGMKDRLTLDWMQALDQFDIAEIKAACSEILRKKPKDVTNEQQVKSEIIAARARVLARLPNELKPPEQTRTEPKFDSDAILKSVRKQI